MTNHVTDTNVEKMTEKEAIAIMQSEIRCNSGTIGDIDELCRLCNHTNECDEGTFNDILKSALNMAIEALQFQQSVVRCKDCIYHSLWNGIDPYCGRFDGGLGFDFDGYCSSGKRRDEE